jgi:dipeptidase E
MARLLLISNSTLYGSGYLDHAEREIRDFLKTPATIAFVPFALYDRNQHAAQARERLRNMGYDLISVHDVSNPERAIKEGICGGPDLSTRRTSSRSCTGNKCGRDIAD